MTMKEMDFKLNVKLEIILICEIDSMSEMKQEGGIDEPL
jgi:hypothetical protein